jgi:hypothetical protein
MSNQAKNRPLTNAKLKRRVKSQLTREGFIGLSLLPNRYEGIQISILNLNIDCISLESLSEI